MPEVLRGRLVTGGSVVEDGVVAVLDDRVGYAGPAAGFAGDLPPAAPDRLVGLAATVPEPTHDVTLCFYDCEEVEASRNGLGFVARRVNALLRGIYPGRAEVRGVIEEEAHRFGLVNQLTEPGGALAGARELAARIAVNGPLAIKATKQLVAGAVRWTDRDLLDHQATVVDAVFTSADAQEGARAFAEKRPPVWQGK